MSLPQDSQGGGNQWFLQVSGPTLGQTDPLHHDEVRLLREDSGGSVRVCGYIAGVFCAIVSHPADTLVSYLNKAPGTGLGQAVNDLGFSGLWAGLGPRIVMIGTLTALQWFIYDGVKV